MIRFPHYKQLDQKDCGPTCLKIISKFYGKTIQIEQLRKNSETSRRGSSLLGLSEAAEKIGFKSLSVKIKLSSLIQVPLPCIIHWNQQHYAVLYKIKKNKYYLSDPAYGHITYSLAEFTKRWTGFTETNNLNEGIALLLEPTTAFNNHDYEQESNGKTPLGLSFIYKYVLRYKKFIWQLIYGLIAVSILQLIFPFLTQSLVDVGIKNQDFNFIYIILFAQVALFLGKLTIEVIRSWILLHLSARINISLISDFFIKLMKLPISFFDSKMTGDILQRINDHKRIERIITTSSLNVLFSFFNLIVFSIVLIYYSIQIFLIFFIGSSLYLIWILLFLKKRRDLDHRSFSEVSQEQSKVIELINGMQDIKLHNAERKKRWSWEFVQIRLFKVSIKSLALEQYQSVGSGFINEFKNILITVLAATLVIKGDITLGMMLAISYIVGQLNSPIAQLMVFIRQVQDAKISLERLSEIHNREDEEHIYNDKIKYIESDSGIYIDNISFRYPGSETQVLKNLSLKIPPNKTTAIVGGSGSGKTTLIKLLLKFYNVNTGIIKIGNQDIREISSKEWREKCGVVMQEGYLFNDTIANNIAIGDDDIDREKLIKAVTVANIKDFIESLPLSYNTKIGNEGLGLSSGQKQRLFIARSVYKNPEFLFFDEATSALDANNEKVIMNHLKDFFENRTAVVIAHRLSTVKNAHQIVVLESGEIVEQGNHFDLVKKKGRYFELVKNQLDLGK